MEAETLGPWLGNFFYIVGGIYVCIQLINSFRRKPHIDVDFSSITTRLANVEDVIRHKQDSNVCDKTHADWDKDVAEIKRRHADHETKISQQIGGIYARIDSLGGSVGTKLGNLEGKIDTYIKLRETHP